MWVARRATICVKRKRGSVLVYAHARAPSAGCLAVPASVEGGRERVKDGSETSFFPGYISLF